MLTKEYIEENYGYKIKEYYKQWKRNVNLDIIPYELTDDEIKHIFNIMIRKGYTFLAAYYKHKDPDIQLMYIDNIKLSNGITKANPSEKKINAKIEGIKLGVLNKSILNTKNVIIDGFTIYIIFKNNNEIYVPYETQQYRVSYGNTCGISRKDFRRILYEEKLGKCYICGRHMDLERKQGNYLKLATVDHIIPSSKGGSNEKSNCIICCGLCNQLKGDEMLTDKLKDEIKHIVDNADTKNLKLLKKELKHLQLSKEHRNETTN